MKLNIFHSVPEALTYSVLILMLLFNVLGDASLIAIVQHHSQTLSAVLKVQTKEDLDTQLIEKQQLCIGAFFLQNNRSALTLNNLKVCQPVVSKLG